MMSRPIRNTLLLACLLTTMALGGVGYGPVRRRL